MSQLKQQIKDINQQYSQLSVREKVMTLAAGLVTILFCGFIYYIEPLWLSTDKLSKELSQLKTDLNSYTQQSQLYQQHLKTDPNLPLFKRQLALDKTLTSITGELDQSVVNLVAPELMLQVMQQILSQMNNIEVINLTANEPAALLAPQAAPTQPNTQQETEEDQTAESSAEANSQTAAMTQNQLNLYRHGISLELSGRYSDLYRFLAEVENLPWQFYWHNFHFTAEQHPNAILSVNIYTLSLEQGFIGL